MTQVPWQVFVAMLLVIVAAIALLVRATSKNAAGDERHDSDRQPHGRGRHHCQAWKQLDAIRRQQRAVAHPPGGRR